MLIWEGYSRLTGRMDDIIRLVVADSESNNPKVGTARQFFILARDIAPHVRVKEATDALICGDCPFAGNNGCYVTAFQAPLSTWRAHQNRKFATAQEIAKAVCGRMVRLGAYGDPAAVPFEVWQAVLRGSKGWTGYTHAWRYCDPRFAQICMASVESADDAAEAHADGWRTFRVSRDYSDLQAREIACLSDAKGLQCVDCGLCNGNPRGLVLGKAPKSIVIAAHGAKVKRALASVR